MASETTSKKLEDIVRHSDLINRVVFDAETMEEVGRVDVLWMFPQINRVLGFVCKTGFLGKKKLAFKLPQLVSVGHDSVLVEGDGEPTVAAKVQQLETLIHREVWSDRGDRIGYIVDCLFNFRSGVIVRYLMVPHRLSSLTDDTYFLPPKAIKSFSDQRVLIDGLVADNLKVYRRGIKSKLLLVRDRLQHDYLNEVTGELRSLAQQLQTFSQETRHRMEHLGDRLRDETLTFVQQAKSRGQSLAEQIRTEGQAFTELFQDFTSRAEAERVERADADGTDAAPHARTGDQVIDTTTASTDVDEVWDETWDETWDAEAEADWDEEPLSPQDARAAKTPAKPNDARTSPPANRFDLDDDLDDDLGDGLDDGLDDDLEEVLDDWDEPDTAATPTAATPTVATPTVTTPTAATPAPTLTPGRDPSSPSPTPPPPTIDVTAEPVDSPGSGAEVSPDPWDDWSDRPDAVWGQPFDPSLDEDEGTVADAPVSPAVPEEQGDGAEDGTEGPSGSKTSGSENSSGDRPIDDDDDDPWI